MFMIANKFSSSAYTQTETLDFSCVIIVPSLYILFLFQHQNFNRKIKNGCKFIMINGGANYHVSFFFLREEKKTADLASLPHSTNISDINIFLTYCKMGNLLQVPNTPYLNQGYQYLVLKYIFLLSLSLFLHLHIYQFIYLTPLTPSPFPFHFQLHRDWYLLQKLILQSWGPRPEPGRLVQGRSVQFPGGRLATLPSLRLVNLYFLYSGIK